MDRLSPQEWIALASHRLARRWRHVDAEQLDEVAADLYRDEKLRSFEPAAAADNWLAPMDDKQALERA